MLLATGRSVCHQLFEEAPRQPPMPSIEHRGVRPRVDESAYVAPNAVLSGDVTVGANASILFGAVITAAGGPVEIGPDCVIMENAVIRGTPAHPARLGRRVLVGPHAHLTGCVLADDAFLATGVTVFNGATIGAAAEVRINGTVHVNTEVPPGTTVPIGWVAVGQPAQLFPPDEHDGIWAVQRTLDFPGTVWGVERSVPKGERTRRYAHALRRHHANDRVLGEVSPRPGSDSPDDDVLEARSSGRRQEVRVTSRRKGVPDDSSVVMPRLFCRDPEAAIDFCVEALDAVELGRRPGPDGGVSHALLTIGPDMLMIEAEWPTLPSRAPATDGSSPVVIFVYVPDVDETVGKATARGAQVLVPPEDQFWGDRIAWIMDPSGHVWTLATRIEETTESERAERWSELLEEQEEATRG